MSGRGRAGLLCLILFAVAVRLGATAYTGAAAAPAEENRLIARNLNAGRGYTFTEFGVTGPTAVRPPVYPLLLTLIGPDHTTAALVINACAGGLSVWAVFVLARRLAVPRPATLIDSNHRPTAKPESELPRPTPPPAAAWLAAAMFAIWPTQVFAATLTQGLAVAVLLTLTGLALLLSQSPAASCAAGLLFGLAMLTEAVLTIPILLCICFVEFGRRWSIKLIVLAVAAVIVGPWLYRNALVFGPPVMMTSNSARQAYVDNGPPLPVPAVSGKDRISLLSPKDYDQLKVSEGKREQAFGKWFVNRVAGHPVEYAGRCLARAAAVITGAVDHPLAQRWTFLIPRGIAACGFFVLPFLARQRAGYWLAVCLSLTIGFVLATAFIRVEARLSVLTDIPQLLALAGAAGLWWQRGVPV